MDSARGTARQVSAADQEIGLRLRKARYKVGLSQKDMAKELGAVPDNIFIRCLVQPLYF